MRTEAQKAWSEQYKPRRNELSRARRAKDPERHRREVREWRSRSHEKYREVERASKIRWITKNPNARRAYWLKLNYNLTLEDYDRMLVAQGGVCKICKRPETKINVRTGKVYPLSVDHDKNTGKVRGLLCDKHNKGIGVFDHNISYLESSILYLKETSHAS